MKSDGSMGFPVAGDMGRGGQSSQRHDRVKKRPVGLCGGAEGEGGEAGDDPETVTWGHLGTT